LKALEVAPEVILASPLIRAWQTAELTAGVLGKIPVQEMTALAPGAHAEEVMRQLRDYANLDSVMLVGHQPHMGELASYLLTGSSGLVPLPFKKGAVAAIEVSAIPPKLPGYLLWFAPAKLLRQAS